MTKTRLPEARKLSANKQPDEVNNFVRLFAYCERSLAGISFAKWLSSEGILRRVYHPDKFLIVGDAYSRLGESNSMRRAIQLFG
jgi:hypothetical protein